MGREKSRALRHPRLSQRRFPARHGGKAEPPSKAPTVELSFPYTFLNKPISL